MFFQYINIVILIFQYINIVNGQQKSSISYRYLKAIPTAGYYTPGGVYSGSSYYIFKILLLLLIYILEYLRAMRLKAKVEIDEQGIYYCYYIIIK